MTEVQEEEKLQETRKDCPLEFLEGAQPCRHLDFGLLASRTAASSHQLMAICYGSHRKLVHPESQGLTEGPRCGLGGNGGVTRGLCPGPSWRASSLLPIMFRVWWCQSCQRVSQSSQRFLPKYRQHVCLNN